MKKLRRLLLGLVVLVVVVVLAGVFSIDLLAKAGLEKGAAYALGVETTVDSLSLSLIGGSLSISGLRIANPEGFGSQYFMESGQFDLQLRTGSIFEQTIEFDKFALDGLEINIEQKLPENNVVQILDNLKKFESDQQAEPSEGKRIKVDRIVIRNVKAHFHLLPGIGPAGPVTVEVPEIELTDVASDDGGGILIGQLVGRIVQAVLTDVFAKSEGMVPTGFLKDLNVDVSGLQKAVDDQLRGLAEKLPIDLLLRKD